MTEEEVKNSYFLGTINIEKEIIDWELKPWTPKIGKELGISMGDAVLHDKKMSIDWDNDIEKE